MPWNWQLPDWPAFQYATDDLAPLEHQFLLQAGRFAGSVAHVRRADRDALTVQIMSEEAHQTSAIEGELLTRDSLQASLCRHLGFPTDHRRIPPAEAGISELMVELYQQHAEPLSHQSLWRWHNLLTQGRRDLKDMGCYRTDTTPMQIVSGTVHDPRVHFEAPPASVLPAEMQTFLDWFAGSAPTGSSPLPILTRAGMAHLRFVTIHPFEDGNGRLSRAIAEKALAEGLGHPVLIPLSQTLNSKRKAYYSQLEKTNRSLHITPWLLYFAKTVLTAQAQAQELVEFVITKTRFFDRHRDQLNERQEKALLRMFREGPQGFAGGLSAENYIRITGTTRPTATRDLQDLVAKGALHRTGQLKGTRYYLIPDS
jgi:Fic family protein